MKKLIVPFIILVALAAIGGCSTKFKIAAPYKNITVIYAYLDMNDTAHYVRVQKAFLDQSKSALTMAQTPDSSFYANIDVKIKRLDFTDTIVIDTIHLNRVDLDQEGYQKQPGVFFTAPNYAYKFKGLLNPNYIYRIIVTNLTTGQVDSSESPIIDDTNDGNFTSNVFSDTGKIDFSSTLLNKSYEFYCQYTSPGSFYFEGLTSPVVIGQALIRFHWDDSDYTAHTKTAQSYDYLASSISLSPNGSLTQLGINIYNIDLYYALNTGMSIAPPHTIRLLDKMEIFVYMGTQDYTNYVQNSLVQGVGLTGSEIEPVYTNVKGNDALGLFTARGMRQGKLYINDNTLDSLEISPILAQSNIKGRGSY